MGTAVASHPLISIKSSATVQEAARLMADCSIAALGITNSDHSLGGIVTERDLSWFVAQAKDASSTTVEDITNDFPLIVEGPIDDRAALGHMSRARVRHLIVQEGDDFRIVSMRDYVMRPAVTDAPDVMAAREVMTAPAVACHEETFFEEAIEILAERDISGMPVVNGSGEVVGVISERDLAHALGGPMVRLALRRHNGGSLHGVTELPRGARRAKEIMTTPAVTVSADTSVEEVARLMRVHQINRIPVMENERLVGVITRGDVLGALAHIERAPVEVTGPPIVVGSSGVDSLKGQFEGKAAAK